MIALFTDFGVQDPYVGQVKAVLAAAQPAHPVIDLLHTVPAFNAHAGAHLLDALAKGLPEGTVLLCVVDPGVGGRRQGLVVEADGRIYVGPDNGLLSVVAGRAGIARYHAIDWQSDGVSDTFHGRDIFAPIAATIAAQGCGDRRLRRIDAPEVCFDAGDLARIIYLDHYGNAWTGLRGGLLAGSEPLVVGGRPLSRRRTFSEAPKGEPFWYVNSVGLVEIAVNRASAAAQLGLAVGDRVGITVGGGSLH